MSEAVFEQRLEGAAHLVAVVAGAHDDVRRQRREPRCDLPHVEVVHLDDARLRGERAADLVGVEAGGGRLHEHPPRRLQEPVRRVEHQRRDQQRRDRVGPTEPGREDHGRRDRRGDEAVQVGQDVAVGAFDVEASLVAVTAREDPRRGQVQRDARERHRQHHATVDLGRRDQIAAIAP